MKALIFNGPGEKVWDTKADPVIVDPNDAIVRIDSSTICGTDLHILNGDVPTVTPGRTLGHEGVGVIVERGSDVRNFDVGDRVLISCITSCGRCDYCRRQMYSHCTSGGWILGNKIDGTQAEMVRIPLADTSLYRLPETIDEEAAVMLSDTLPTSYECGVINGAIKPGDSVAIVGAGPIGLAALLTAQLMSPGAVIMIDPNAQRLQVAKELGATHIVDNSKDNAESAVMGLTNKMGVDVAIEAVGLPETFDICQQIIAPGGHIANIGVHGKPATLRLERLWDRNISIATRLVDTATTSTLIKTVASGALDPSRLITHRFCLNDMMKAYDAFGHAVREKAIKVIINATGC